MKKQTIAVLAAAGTAAAAASIPYFHRQNTDLQADHYVFRSPKVSEALNGFRIVQVPASETFHIGGGRDIDYYRIRVSHLEHGILRLNISAFRYDFQKTGIPDALPAASV